MVAPALISGPIGNRLGNGAITMIMIMMMMMMMMMIIIIIIVLGYIWRQQILSLRSKLFWPVDRLRGSSVTEGVVP